LAVLLICQVQLGLAPGGQVIGIDRAAALKLGAARGCALAMLAELRPAAEVRPVGELRASGRG
jgi:hypothetical protein